MRRRSLLLGSSAVAASRALAQPMPVISDTVPPRVGAGPLTSMSAGPPGATLSLSFMTPGTLDPRLTFTRASTATYFDGTGTMQTAAINAPRWDYDPVTHVLLGLLIEEARTNLLLNSATLGTQSVTTTAVATTLSFYGTGTVTLTGTSTAGPLTGTGTFPKRVSLTFTPTAGTLTLTVTGSVLSAQLEVGGFNTSYIPTTAAAVTRATDSCTIPPANMGFYVNPGGSWSAEFIRLNPTIPAGLRIVGRLGSSPSPTPLYINPSQLLGQYDAVSMTTANATTANSVLKGASTFVPGATTICLNAGAVASSAALSIGYFMAGQGVFLMANSINPAETLSGYVRRVSYWPRVLTNAEMQSVTT